MKPQIHAVIWIDTGLGLPLSLKCDTPEMAVEKAKAMTATKGFASGFVVELRAVTLQSDDTLTTLFAA